eukprot:TRINITY_DN7475_c0_g1_i1.p1 TRINITY_DN7475_c0_g1~~TRINITY_DN7475_c0_g1_i1.p1  ORF type:complete len:398 (-),score=64.44 TRINITY_DN7475_c0_g1_i1:167-1360(-)
MANKGGVREGDWNCPLCSNHNYANRQVCNRCGAPRPDAAGGSAQAAAQAAAQGQGTWNCALCNNHNFANRQVCNRCSAPRTEAGGFGPAAAEGAFGGGFRGSSPYGAAGGKGGVQPPPPPEPQPHQPQPQQPQQQQQPQADLHHGDPSLLELELQEQQEPQQLQHLQRPQGKAPAQARPGASMPTMLRAGDWICPDCGNHNYADKKQCRRCGRVRPAGIGLGEDQFVQTSGDGMSAPWYGVAYPGNPPPPSFPPNMRPDDWLCKVCNNHNYANRETCNKCGVKKNVIISKTGMRQGDWICTFCNNHNWADKLNCNKCGQPKDAAKTPLAFQGVEQQKDRELREGDWICPMCSNHNYAARHACNKCGTLRPDPELAMEMAMLAELQQFVEQPVGVAGM